MATSTTETKSREEIHLPSPSLIPLVTGVGLAILVLGLIVNWVMTAVGGIVLVVSILWWIAELKRDYDGVAE